jgi:hypothetical protein
VQIEKKQNQSTPSSLAATSSGTKVAQEYAATFLTQLALARWTRGGDIPHVHCFDHQIPMRTAWYEQEQRHFQAWLEAGGFHQSEPGSSDSDVAETRPQGDTQVELNSNTVPHRDPRSVLPPATSALAPASRPAPDANGKE